MHTRPVWTASFVLAAAMFAACGNQTGSPAIGENTAPPAGQATAPSSMAPGGSVSGEAMATFCDDWTSQVAAAWPPDAATASTLAPKFAAWAQSPAFATVGTDLSTVGAWLTMQGASTTAAAPDAATTDAYNRIVTFVTANC